MQVLLGRLLVKSPSPEVKARGIALLEKLAQAGQWNAKAELAIAIRCGRAHCLNRVWRATPAVFHR